MSEQELTKQAPAGVVHDDPAPKCPVCGGPRYWSDYWTDQLVALCVRCEAARQAEEAEREAEEAEREAYNRWKARVYAAEDMIKATDPRWADAEAAFAAAERVRNEAEKAYHAAVVSRADLDNKIREQAKVAGGPRPPRPRHDALRRQALSQEKKP